MSIGRDSVPRMGKGFRLQWEAVQNAHVLLYPEGMVKLNGSAGEILNRCDGATPVGAIVADLEQCFSASGLACRRARLPGNGAAAALGGLRVSAVAPVAGNGIGPPLWLLRRADLPLPAALRVLLQPGGLCAQEDRTFYRRLAARAARGARARRGAVRLLRRRAAACATTWKILVAEARRLGYYTNLITSGIGLNEMRIAALKDAGLDHIQLSFQDSTREMNDFLSVDAARSSSSAKRAELIKAARLPDGA